MALSTRARLAGIGGALAIGVLGAGGAAYAAGSGSGDPGVSYVTTVEGGTGPAPSTGDTGGTREDCPDGGGSQGPEGSAGAPSGTGSDAGDA